MVRDIVHQILEKHSIPQEGRLVVGVSGGVDSMVLLHVLQELNRPMVVAHVNYHKRGDESDADEALVRRTAESMQLPCHVLSVHYRRQEGNFQDWARRIRYRFFDDLRQKHDAVAVVTAHQRGDQVETILMKVLRGAGPLAWEGMKEWDGVLLRPLLQATRSEIEQYAHDHKVPFREDRSNFRSDFARNFLRNEWTPLLDRQFPGWQQNILRLRDWSTQIEGALAEIEKQLKVTDDSWDFDGFCELPPELQRLMIRFWLKKFAPDENPAYGGLRQTGEIHHLQSGQFLSISPAIRLWRDRDRLFFRKEDQPAQIIGQHIEKEQLLEGNVIAGFAEFSLSDEYPRNYSEKLYCRLKDDDWPLIVRSWKPGDRFQPLGMKGRQLVSDFLTNRKVPSYRRKEVLVAVSSDQTICAVIFPPVSGLEPGGIAEKVRCPEQPAEVLNIRRTQE